MQHIGDKLVFQIQHYLRATYARRLCHRQNGQNAAIIGALTLHTYGQTQLHYPTRLRAWVIIHVIRIVSEPLITDTLT